MINFEPLISGTVASLIGVILLMILAWQIYGIATSSNSKKRKAIQVFLHVLFTFSVLGFILQPVLQFVEPEKAVLIYSDSMSREKVRFWRDSLQVNKAQRMEKFDGIGNPVYLLGDDFTREDLLTLETKEVNWLSEPQAQQLDFLEWNGLLREGEVQSVYGSISSSAPVQVKLSAQNQVIQETSLEAGSTAFRLEFPVSVLGRNELSLTANEDTLGIIKFFAYAKKPVSYHFQFSFPDPEVRFLSQYLRKQGSPVRETIQVSRDATIQTAAASTDSVPILIIDPSQLKSRHVKNAVDSGASVFIMNLFKPDQDILAINQALNASFNLKRSGAEESREINSQLSAAAFEFESQLAQIDLLQQAIAIQQVGNSKIGVSVLNQSFPIHLAGDSLKYKEIWDEVFAAMYPKEQSSISIIQPVIQGLDADVMLSRKDHLEDFITMDKDTVFLQQSLLNPFIKTGSFSSTTSGWVTLADSLEFYSYAPMEWTDLSQAKMKADFFEVRSRQTGIAQPEVQHSKIPGWVWYVLILLSMSLVWVEPKVRLS